MKSKLLIGLLFLVSYTFYGQSAELMTILKEKLDPTSLDRNVNLLRSYVENRETNGNEYASKVLSKSDYFITQGSSGAYKTKQLLKKLNEANNHKWDYELENLIEEFNNIKGSAEKINDRASSLYYLYLPKSDVTTYYNRIVDNLGYLIDNINDARSKTQLMHDIFLWELTYVSEADQKKEIEQQIAYSNSISDRYNTSSGGSGQNQNTNSSTKKMGCITGNCVNGIGKYVWVDGNTYVGEFKDDQVTGFGTFYYHNNDVYVGTRKNTKRHGYGKYISNNGNITSSYVNNGVETNTKVEDYKAIYDVDKTKRGCISGDCENGQGIYIFTGKWDGDIYIGMWKNGVMDGVGNYYYKSGAIYTGEWKNNKMNGRGSYLYENKDTFVGNWKDSNKHGSGIYIYADNSIKKGRWENNVFIE